MLETPAEITVVFMYAQILGSFGESIDHDPTECSGLYSHQVIQFEMLEGITMPVTDGLEAAFKWASKAGTKITDRIQGGPLVSGYLKVILKKFLVIVQFLAPIYF